MITWGVVYVHKDIGCILYRRLNKGQYDKTNNQDIHGNCIYCKRTRENSEDTAFHRPYKRSSNA